MFHLSFEHFMIHKSADHEKSRVDLLNEGDQMMLLSQNISRKPHQPASDTLLLIVYFSLERVNGKLTAKKMFNFRKADTFAVFVCHKHESIAGLDDHFLMVACLKMNRCCDEDILQYL